MTADPTTATIDRLEVARTLSDYADVVNRRAWGELAALFPSDAVVRVDTVTRPATELVGPHELGDFIGTAVERFAFFEFVVLNARIELDDDDADRAVARVFMCEVRRDVDTLDWSVAYGVYHDRFRRWPDRWRFERRDYRSLTRTGGEVFPLPHGLGPGPLTDRPPGGDGHGSA